MKSRAHEDPSGREHQNGTIPSPSHSPDMLLGVVGASNQAGDQVCKAGTPRGEGPPPTPQHTPTSAPGHPIPLPNKTLLLIWVLPFMPPCLEGQEGMAPWPLAPWHNLWCLWLCLTQGCHLTWGFRVLEGVVAGCIAWGSPTCPQSGRTWMFRGLRAMGTHPGVSKKLSSSPCMGRIPGVSLHPRVCCPHTWVLRGCIGQEEASSRTVAGAVEQDGHSAGVCHQEWGRRDGVPAVGPCQQGWHHGEDLGFQGTCLGIWTPGLHLPRLGPCQGQGGSSIWAVLRVVPELFHIQGVPSPG